MTRIADLLDRDFSKPVAELVKVNNGDPDTVFTELTEYVATDGIKTAYESLFSAMAAAPKSPNQGVGVWISGFFGSGKSSFAKNLGYVLANREVLGVSASSLFLKQVESQRLTGYIEFLNRAVPCEVIMCDIQVDVAAQTNVEQIAEVMCRVLRRDLDYAEDYDISELEIELEKEGKFTAFQDLCRAEYKADWRKIRKGSQKFARSSTLLHRLDARTYASTDTWLNMLKARPSRRLSVEDLVEKLFDLCEVRRHGKTFAFILDDIGPYLALGGERLENLCTVVEQFGKESLQRLKAGKIPGPAWIIVTAEEKLQEVVDRAAASRIDLPKLDPPQLDLPELDLPTRRDRFQHQIDLSSAGIHEVAARRVLRKKESQESILRKMFRDCGASLIQNVKLERCSRRTEFDEDRFVRLYPYLPHLIDLSIDIMAGIRLHPKAPGHPGGGNRAIVKQCFEMIVSDQTQLDDQPVGVLVSIDKIYELVEGNIPLEKQQNVLDIHQRFDHEDDYGGMAARVAKAICLMEFVKTDLPRTTKNIAALLVHRVNECPPTLAVAEMLHLMKEAQFVRETGDGWKLYDFDELRRAAASLGGLNNAVGTVNPRLPGWSNDLVQLGKKLLARGLTWYTRPLHEFNASASQLLEEIVGALGRLSAKMVAPDRLAVDLVALEARLAQSETRSATLAASMQEQLEILQQQVQALAGVPKTGNPQAPAGGMATDCDKRAPKNFRFYIDPSLGNDRTAYIIGLFGTGRRYINEQMVQNIGPRAKYFRDTIRLHPGPTSMIYSGHATIRHVSSLLQYPPVITSRILESVGSGFADLIFVHRHPLDSLLTNWIWWRTYIRDNRMIDGISQVYENTDDLYVDLEQNFLEFEAFAKGDPDFFAGVPGSRFLSFPEFVEETELFLQSATLAVRLEDFMIDPLKEFSKIAEVMSVDLDVSRICVAPPRTKPYGYLSVKDKVPRFRDFFNGLNAETKSRIEKIGYDVTI
jgi:hypothetical protein